MASQTSHNPVKVYFLCILICLSVGAIAGYATSANITGWYATLVKPSFNPPNAVFGPVWTFLYILMGMAWAMVLTNHHADVLQRQMANRLFILQLFFNFSWSFLFFNIKYIGLAWLDLWALWFTLSLTVFYFWRISRAAGLMLVIYWCWVSFANVLNGSIWYLN